MSDFEKWWEKHGDEEVGNEKYTASIAFEAGRAFGEIDPDWLFHSWPSSEVLSKDKIDAAKRRLDPRTFRQEYEASFETASGRVYDDYSNDNQQLREQIKGLEDYIEKQAAVIRLRNEQIEKLENELQVTNLKPCPHCTEAEEAVIRAIASRNYECEEKVKAEAEAKRARDIIKDCIDWLDTFEWENDHITVHNVRVRLK